MCEVNGEVSVHYSSEVVDSQSSGSSIKTCEAFDTALKWLESLGDVNPSHLLLVKKWGDIAARK